MKNTDDVITKINESMDLYVESARREAEAVKHLAEDLETRRKGAIEHVYLVRYRGKDLDVRAPSIASAMLRAECHRSECVSGPFWGEMIAVQKSSVPTGVEII